MEEAVLRLLHAAITFSIMTLGKMKAHKDTYHNDTQNNDNPLCDTHHI
jgi:hypothetical protein